MGLLDRLMQNPEIKDLKKDIKQVMKDFEKIAQPIEIYTTVTKDKTTGVVRKTVKQSEKFIVISNDTRTTDFNITEVDEKWNGKKIDNAGTFVGINESGKIVSGNYSLKAGYAPIPHAVGGGGSIPNKNELRIDILLEHLEKISEEELLKLINYNDLKAIIEKNPKKKVTQALSGLLNSKNQ